MKIRHMIETDVQKMIDLGRLMHMESNFRHRNFDSDKLELLGQTILTNPTTWCGLVAEHDNTVIGMYVGYMTEFWFGRDAVAQEYLLYVQQTRRGSLAAVKLIKEYEQWAWQNGATEIRPSTSTGIQRDRIRSFYEHMGYEVTGYTFRKTK